MKMCLNQRCFILNLLATYDTDELDFLTDIVLRWNQDPKQVESQLYRFAYQTFRNIASDLRAKSLAELDDNTWLRISCNTTSLVHEAFIKVSQGQGVSTTTSRELYLLFSQVIYSILIDNIRKSQAKKRLRESDLTQQSSFYNPQQLIYIEQVLKRLAVDYPRQVSVFIYKYVCLSSLKDISLMLGISESSVDKDLSFIKKCLSLHLNY
uniref:RNA polymerase, sigma-24 subunit, ECF subfamily n=1 Tax=Shewanella sp. (strain MR-7) TaxID=60481 RepID=Q0HW85_SHESR